MIASVLLLALPLFSQGVSADTRAETYSLFIPDSIEQYHQGMKIFVAGMEHNLTFRKTSENITVTIYSESYFDEGLKDTTTYYRWKYLNGNFSDTEYGTYINLSSSAIFGNEISFHIGTDSRVEGAGNNEEGAQWHIKIVSNGKTFIEDNIFVEKLNPAYSLSRPEFEFRVNPGYTGKIFPTVKDYNVTIRSKANIPLALSVEYDKMGEIFEATNVSGILKPGDVVYSNIYLKAIPWSPRIFSVIEKINALPLHIMPSERAEVMSLITQLKQDVHITVKVVRQGFDIIDIGVGNLQYERGPQVADYNEERIMRCFLNGNGTVRFTVTPSDLLIKGIYYHGTSTGRLRRAMGIP